MAGNMAGNAAPRRVLVVDDVEAMRVMIRRALSASGYAVDVAATLGEARRMKPSGYAAVVVDVGLGAEQGIDLLDTLRAEDQAAAGRCLLITGGPTAVIPAGVAFLAKPFGLSELVAAVRALEEPALADPAPLVAGVPAGAPLPERAQPAGDEPGEWRLLRLIRRLRARERHELVGFLHDGPIQELTAVSLELQMMARSAAQPDEVRATAGRLGSATASLRWLVDGNWPFITPEARLAPAIAQRTAWLLAEPATVDAAGPPAGPRAVEVPVVVDVVELMLIGMVPEGQPARAHVAVRAQAELLSIELTLSRAAADGYAGDRGICASAAAEAALDELAAALGATAHAEPAGQRWRGTLALPRQREPALSHYPG